MGSGVWWSGGVGIERVRGIMILRILSLKKNVNVLLEPMKKMHKHGKGLPEPMPFGIEANKAPNGPN